MEEDFSNQNLTIQQKLQLELKQKREEIAKIKEKKEQQEMLKKMEKMNKQPSTIPIDEKPKTFAQLLAAAKQQKKDQELIDKLLVG